MKCAYEWTHRLPERDWNDVEGTIRRNLEYRLKTIKWAEGDDGRQEALRAIAAEDPIWYINTFVYTFDPRESGSRTVPFVTYPFQDDAIKVLVASAGEHDVLAEKSRDMGMSWIALAVIEWMWHFQQDASILVGSRKLEYVYKKGDMKALFQKLERIVQYLPEWMQPSYEMSELHLQNNDNGSTIDGESNNPNFGTGDRRLIVMLDEFAKFESGAAVDASTADVTRSRWFISTPFGTANRQYQIRQQAVKTGTPTLLTLHWSKHPLKAQGLYTSHNGKLQILDEHYTFEDGYPFILDGKLRSPWYDGECRRRASDQDIAQELDIDYRGSGSPFFDASAIDASIERYARAPDWQGDLFFADDLEILDWQDSAGGPLRLWISLDDLRDAVEHGEDFLITSDISAGTGASNSVHSIWRYSTREKIGEYTSPHIAPERFAQLGLALAFYLNDAKMKWDAFGGCGASYGKTVFRKYNYWNVYYHKNDEDATNRTTTKPGWFGNGDRKSALLGFYRMGLGKLDVRNPSEEGLDECRHYVHGVNGPEHSASKGVDDPSGARANHGDRCIADALGYDEVAERPKIRKRDDEPEDLEANPPIGSIAYRRKERQRAERVAAYVI